MAVLGILIAVGLVALFVFRSKAKAVPVSPDVPMATLYLEVWIPGGQKAAGALCGLTWDDGGCAVTLNHEGNGTVKVPITVQTVAVTITLAGYVAYSSTLSVQDQQHYPITLTRVAPPHVTLPALKADGRVFRLPDGAIWRWQGMTAFTLLKRYLDGEDITPFLTKAKALGVNILRVLCRVQWGPLNPKAVGDYFGKLDAFLQVVEDAGLRVELVALADCATCGHNVVSPAFTLTRDEQRTFLLKVAEVASRHTHTVVEWGNEFDYNGWSPDLFPSRLPLAVLQSRGSGGMQTVPPKPPLDYGTYHCGRDAEWPRKMGKQAAEYSYGCGGASGDLVMGIPVVDDEPQKIVAGKTDSATDFYTGFAVSALFCAGATIHSQSLLTATWPTGAELAAVEAAAQAWRDIPLSAPLGSYTRGGLSSCPLEHTDLEKDAKRGALRTFCQLSGNTAICVVVRPGAQWTAKAVKGWTITKQIGPLKNVVFLEKTA